MKRKMVTRRVFMKEGAAAFVGIGSAFVLPHFLIRAAYAAMPEGSTPDAKRKTLIVLFQRGAADGLSMVIPFAEDMYYNVRPTISVPLPLAGVSNGAIDLDGFFALHPALAPFKDLYDGQHLAIVHAAGSPDSTRSHFDAQDFMETGTPGDKTTIDGWLNRYLLARKLDAEKKESPFRAVALGQRLPRILQGEFPAVSMPSIKAFDVQGGGSTRGPAQAGQARARSMSSGFEAMYAQGVQDLLYGTGRETFDAVKMLRAANPAKFEPDNGAVYPRGAFGDALKQIAQLIKSDIGLEIAFADSGGWDTHANQGGIQGQLAINLRSFSQGIAALHRDLGDRMNDVVIVTLSEFGRTVRENGNRGTDHGHANAIFVLGGGVKGGKVYGRWPGLSSGQLHEGRDLAITTDFRDVLGEIVSRHLGLSELSGVFPGHEVNTLNFRGIMG